MIKKVLLYFLVITGLLFAARTLLYKGLLKTQGFYEKYTTAFCKKNDFNVLFLGSSRAEMHYDTGLFDSLTHSHSFNLSLAGATPHVAFAALKTYLANSPAPRFLIYEVDYHALSYEAREIKEFDNYFPFLNNLTLRKEFNTIDPRMEHFYYDPYFSFPFTGLKSLSSSLHGWLNIPGKTDTLFHNGFFKEVFRPHLNYLAEKKKYSFFNVTEHNYLDSIILTCKKNNVHITLASSPVFAGGKTELYNKDRIISQLENIAASHGISYFDLSSLPFCNNRELFIDHYHMNYAGAEKFTRHFSRVFNNKIVVTALK